MFSVPLGVLGLIAKDHKILRSVVSFVSVNVMNHFAPFKRTAKHLLCDYAVFVLSEVLPVTLTRSGIRPGPAQLLAQLGRHAFGIVLTIIFT